MSDRFFDILILIFRIGFIFAHLLTLWMIIAKVSGRTHVPWFTVFFPSLMAISSLFILFVVIFIAACVGVI